MVGLEQSGLSCAQVDGIGIAKAIASAWAVSGIGVMQITPDIRKTHPMKVMSFSFIKLYSIVDI